MRIFAIQSAGERPARHVASARLCRDTALTLVAFSAFAVPCSASSDSVLWLDQRVCPVGPFAGCPLSVCPCLFDAALEARRSSATRSA